MIGDVTGQTGRANIRSIVLGERDPKALVRDLNRRVKVGEQDIVHVQTGNLREERLFVVGAGAGDA